MILATYSLEKRARDTLCSTEPRFALMACVQDFMRILTVLVLLLTGCSWVPSVPGLSSYKIDIQQGNYVTQDMIAKLKPGMTRSQVRFALGTPLIADAFHPDRWDYVYVLSKRGRVIEQRRIVVVFQDDKLLRIEGDVVPMNAGATPDASGGSTGAAK